MTELSDFCLKKKDGRCQGCDFFIRMRSEDGNAEYEMFVGYNQAKRLIKRPEYVRMEETYCWREGKTIK